MFDLVLKVAIITGGANGIGSFTVRKFLDEGARFVAFIDIDRAAGVSLENELRSKYGRDRVKFFNGDVTSDNDLFQVFNYAMSKYGCIDVVVNNAGVADEKNYKRTIDVNVRGVVGVTLKALEIMRKDTGGKGGTIINISSTLALTLSEHPTLFVYDATKAAVILFSNNLGTENYYKYTGVRVITVCFGLTDTTIIDNMEGIDDISTNAIREFISTLTAQPPQIAAEGVVEAYKRGNSGSTWCIENSNITDITQSVKRAYKIMSARME